MQSNTNRSANAGETGRLEGSCKLIFSVYRLAYAFFKCMNRREQISNRIILAVNLLFTASPQNTSTSTTSQRLNSQIGQVVNRARDILRSNRSSFTRNASTSFQNGATSAYPKRPRLSGASRYGNVLPKDVVKTVVLLENSGSSNEYPLKNDTIMCYAEVDFVTTDDERLVRNKIVGALKTQIPDIAPDDFEFVKVLGKRVSTPAVADGYNWDFKLVKNLCGRGKLYVRLNKQQEQELENISDTFEAIPVERPSTILADNRGVSSVKEPACQSEIDDEVFTCICVMSKVILSC